MKLLLCLLMLVSNAAGIQDMTGKVFTFPQESVLTRVKLNTEYDQGFTALTVCHRSFTDLTRDHALFSLATPSQSNAVLNFFDSRLKSLCPHLHDFKLSYGELDYAPNKWHSMCTTWQMETNLVQLWFDGQPLTKKHPGGSSGTPISGTPFILLGQDQDSYGGSFEAKQSFVGMMTDVHMWDHVISPCEIQKYMNELSFTPGNVINWAALDFQSNGNVLAENKIEQCDSKWFK